MIPREIRDLETLELDDVDRLHFVELFLEFGAHVFAFADASLVSFGVEAFAQRVQLLRRLGQLLLFGAQQLVLVDGPQTLQFDLVLRHQTTQFGLQAARRGLADVLRPVRHPLLL